MTQLLAQTDSITNAAGAISRGLQAVPWAPAALAAVATAFGLLLWLFGGRLMRGATLLAFIGAGALAGYAILPRFFPGAPAWVGLVIGLMCGVVLGSMMFRLSMAAALAVMLGIAAPTVIAVARGLHAPIVQTSVPAGRALLERSGWRAAQEELEQAAEADADAPPPDVLAEASEFARQLSAEAGAQWDAMPVAHKSLIFLSGIGAAALGFGIGLVAPGFAASAITAGFGAAVWLSAGAALAGLLHASWSQRMPQQAISWLVIWVAISAIGAAFQWASVKKSRPADKRRRPAPEPTDPPPAPKNVKRA